MGHQDPKQAIIAYLSEPSVLVSPASAPQPGQSVWRGEVRKGGMDAKPETIYFHKQRNLDHRQVHFVTFEDKEGRQMHCACHVVEESDGSWKSEGGGGGGGWGSGSLPRIAPWANLAGGGWEQANQFYAGGYVEDIGKGVVRVDLVSKNGV